VRIALLTSTILLVTPVVQTSAVPALGYHHSRQSSSRSLFGRDLLITMDLEPQYSVRKKHQSPKVAGYHAANSARPAKSSNKTHCHSKGVLGKRHFSHDKSVSSNGGETSQPPLKQQKVEASAPKLACPYFKKDKERCPKSSCWGRGWARVHRIK
jgi:hypothetical protein